ncbi:uncharacterized protein LOC126764587 [Bactrocera neohumeralis]|uniref:uncharacterized protein LOC126764587 n=1 Tax=Bactrocera neohumeralis TaxID=98809 RepID=UPI0021657A97|nr:uncharacterized protein LOC126764587 [Bactrocera neohumeralis]
MSLEHSKRKRANIKRNISRIKSIVEGSKDFDEKPSHAELQCRLGILESYFKQALSVQADIEDLDPSDTGRADLEDSYVTAKLCIQAQLGDEGNVTINYPETTAPTPVSTPSFLPRLSLPVAGNRKSLPGITSLFTLQTADKSNYQQLRSLIDKASAIFSSLESLGTSSNIAQAMLIYIVIGKCDQQTRNKWNESLDYKSLPTWIQCTQVLERHCQFLHSSDSSSHHKFESTKPIRISTRGQNSSFAITKLSCVLCSSDKHKLIGCSQFKDMNTNQRYDAAKKYDLCINCLSNGHRVAQCASKHRCRSCNRTHHTLLHHDNATLPTLASPTSLPVSQSFQPSSSCSTKPHTYNQLAATHSHMETSDHGQVILATALVLVKDSTGAYKLGRALLDSCSQVNFMTDEFAQRLHLRREKYHIGIRSIGDSVTNLKARTTTTIKSRTSAFQLSLQFGITPHIAYQPDAEIDTINWNLPANTTLADETFFKPRRIDLLLGTEAFFEALAIGQIKLGQNLPKLQKTLFGWVVSGRYQSKHYTPSRSCLLFREDSIDANMQRLWELETVDCKPNPISSDHRICERHFMATTHQDTTGRIIVRLPFKDNPAALGASYDITRRRFLAIERRLSHSPDTYSQYVSFMEEYERLGHMSVVKAPKLDEPHYYIPHHCVLKPTSASTKLRVVFDASCQTTTQTSLNDLLLVGPTIQTELYMLLLRFRLYRYAITADVTKMYRQVSLNKNDRKFHYILWRASADADLLTYQLNTVTYGTASAPYLAVRSLHYLADKHMAEFPIGAAAVKTSFYVDDFLCGADDTDALHTLKKEVIEILQRGQFPLSKWHSNHPDFMEGQTMKELSVTDDFTSSALGVTWNQRNDTLLFSFTPKQVHKSVTKRTILSIASSLFDPLGVLSPVVITSKIIMQELWLLKLDWDDSVPQHIHQAWNCCLASLNSLSSLSLPRYCLLPNARDIQLHGFCDASIRAYGSAIYIRVEDSDGKVAVHLLTSKSRVAPVKKQSLPKLELCGAHLLACLYAKIKNIFTSVSITTFFWTVSQLVLHWIKQHSVTLSTFVGNRVSDIQELTAGGQWRYVPSKENPADLVSRGCPAADLKSSIWFSGPHFLQENAMKWPRHTGNIELDMDIVNREKRKKTFAIVKEVNYLIDVIDGISSYLHCLRLIAWLFRFSDKCRRKYTTNTISPSPDELRRASYCIIFNIQQQHFSNDIQLLRKNQALRSNLKFLTPFLDNVTGFELIKVGGRLDYADLPNSQKHPILLPSDSQFVLKYVRHLHLRNFHAGPKALVAFIRLEFWIVNARDVARRIVRSCVHCVRYKPVLLQQVMGPLPVTRITPARPFERCGIDFCGPINTYLRIRGKPPTKSYLAVFVCLVTKAVHIEVVSDLSTNAFLNALKRMSGRRKMPCDIFCDNATNFVGASNQLKNLKQILFKTETLNEIHKYCSSDFINFHFIPPRAPHFGGPWEAAVKSAKGLLNRTLANTKLTFEELSTVAVEVEAILNSRPLCSMSSDPNDFGALTAGHFLVGDSLRGLPERSLELRTVSHVDRYNTITAIKQSFWRRWSVDYINELRARVKWTTPSPNLTKGALVIIHDDNLPPQRWRLGRVESTVLGRDGRVRVVNLRTANGTLCRPIHKLAILPIS